MAHAEQTGQLGAQTRVPCPIAQTLMASAQATAWVIAARCAAAIAIATMTRKKTMTIAIA